MRGCCRSPRVYGISLPHWAGGVGPAAWLWGPLSRKLEPAGLFSPLLPASTPQEQGRCWPEWSVLLPHLLLPSGVASGKSPGSGSLSSPICKTKGLAQEQKQQTRCPGRLHASSPGTDMVPRPAPGADAAVPGSPISQWVAGCMAPQLCCCAWPCRGSRVRDPASLEGDTHGSARLFCGNLGDAPSLPSSPVGSKADRTPGGH